MCSSEFQIFCPFHISKWQLLMMATKLIPKGQIRKYFICYIMFEFFSNSFNSKAKLVVTVSLIVLFTVKYKASVGLCVEK